MDSQWFSQRLYAGKTDRQKKIKWVLVAFVALLVSSCSGGGGGGNNNQGQGNSLPTGPQPVVFIANNGSLTAVYSVLDDASALPVRLDTGLDGEPNMPLPRNFEVSPNRQWVAIFVQDVVGGGARVYIASMDGSLFHQVLANTFTLEDYQWSPTGDALVYTSDQETPGVHEVYLAMAEDGSVSKINAPVTVFDNEDFETPIWSPDGRYVLLQVRSLATGEIDRFEVFDTQNPTATPIDITSDVPKPMELVLSVGWSPDSQQVAFIYDSTTLSTRELWASLVDGSGSIQLNPDPTAAGTGVLSYQWAPDSTQIAYISKQRNLENSEVFVVDADGTNPTIQHSPFADSSTRGARDVKWSPSGEYLAYTSNHGVNFASYQLYVVTDRLDNRDAAVLQTTVDGSVDRWEWMPDSSGIVYMGDSFGPTPMLYIKEPLELHSPTSLPITEDRLSSFGSLIREDVTEFKISPDNIHVAYMQLHPSISNSQLRVNPIGGVRADITDLTVAASQAKVDVYHWSPAGDRIMYTVTGTLSGGGTSSNVFVEDVDGSNRVSLNGNGAGLTVLVGGLAKASY